jgi:hypothetical protein
MDQIIRYVSALGTFEVMLILCPRCFVSHANVASEKAPSQSIDRGDIGGDLPCYSIGEFGGLREGVQGFRAQEEGPRKDALPAIP